ncbi:bifunctional cytochrome P450/NADPH--P450 reductase [Archangium lansingense]|uniref:Bifunctional cytochrome P450/NADPH--P450 reductase n=1 Tax=Archangium lansingense TaxID=2995310 RepID=A0ABT3ZY72_9BACT|nr:cytochrome P450 [Archangium lansinium]MCY1073954.1 cytochrome P450 [Archangium lansinium]
MRATPARASIPQPRTRPLVGNIPDVASETPIQSMMRLSREYGPLFRLSFPGRSMLVLGSHALVNEVCDEKRFDKLVITALENIREFAGDGLFTAHTHEPNWERAHRILLPAFGPQAMRGYFDLMLDIAEQLVEKWARLGPDAELDVPDNMTRLTLDTIALCGFGYRFNSFYQREMHPFVDAMVRSLAEAGERTRRLPLQTRLMLMTRQQYQRDIAYMHEVVDQVIQERRRSGDAATRKDLLSLMLQGVDSVSGQGLDDLNIRYQVVTFLIAGHETTSGLLSFALYLLLKHPDVLARATAEVDRVLGRDVSQRPTFEQMHQLTYLDQVLRESLRLWPTAPAFALQSREDTLLGGTWPVRKGEPLMILTPMLHRDPEVWPEPERFDPDRFTPEAVAARPPNAWKPFGNGQRACIGRQFAMQEATLVLAMLLQRFQLIDHTRYQLRIKETLTLKPEDFRIRVRARGDEQDKTVVALRPAPKAAPTKPTWTSGPVARHGTPLLVLYGSNMGSSEAFARRIASDAELQGYASTVATMDAYSGRLPREGAVVIVSASYNGHPPDNAKAFCHWLEELSPGALTGVRYTVFGCGNRDWAATWQSVPKRVDELLAAAGAQRLLDRGEADARGDFFGDFDGWYESVWPRLGEAFGVTASEASQGPRYEVERLEQVADPLEAAHGVVPVKVVANRELVDMTSPFGRSKRHLEVRLPEGMSYRTGDHLAVLPENAPEQVERVARRFGLKPEETVLIRRTREEQSTLPLDRPVTVRSLLGHYVELSAPATRRDLLLLAKYTACPPEKKRLLALAGEGDSEQELYRTQVLDKRVSVLDLLEEFPACELPFGVFLELLPPMKPRRYSISSSPLDAPERCALTVAVIDAPAWSGRGRYRGACSSHLARVEPGSRLLATLREPHSPFRPPEDPSAPLVMIGAGTGLAPFRGFIQERARLAERGTPLGKALLFFGCDHPDVDFLYREELEAWQAQGVVEVFPAFFRQERDGVTFVQHRLWEERARVGALLDTGARLYVCGDGRYMAPAVRETVARIHQERAGCTGDQAADWLREMEQQQRYLADVFA